eukprot:6253416-Prymnesium_polylepis.1
MAQRSSRAIRGFRLATSSGSLRKPWWEAKSTSTPYWRIEPAPRGCATPWTRSWTSGAREAQVAGDCDLFRAGVRLERMLHEAFEAPTLPVEALCKINKLDRVSYMAILTQTCTVCGKRMQEEMHMNDRDAMSRSPLYTHAHVHCHLKHMP